VELNGCLMLAERHTAPRGAVQGRQWERVFQNQRIGFENHLVRDNLQ
jgi:hypothetical protein